jgi:hypothetical protein
MEAQAGGFLAQPPGLDGDATLGIAGISGAPRGRTWDAVTSAQCRELPGDQVTFTTLGDGEILVEEDVPDGSLAPLADGLETSIEPPYRAAATRAGGDVWTAVAESVSVVELPGLDADEVVLTVVDGVREITIDGERTSSPLAALDAIAAEYDSVALHAERIDGSLFAVDVFPL